MPAPSQRVTPNTHFIALLLGRHSHDRVYLLAWLTAAALFSVATITLITSTVGTKLDQAVDLQGLGIFLIIAIMIIYSQFRAVELTVDTCETAVEKQRSEFAHALRYANLQTVEAISTAKLYGLLNRTTAVLTEAGPPVITALTSSGVMICIGFYTLYLSPLTFIVMVVVTTATTIIARDYFARAEPDIYKSHVTERTYMDLFIQLLDGSKEVKQNTKVGDDLQNNYITAAAAQTHVEKGAASYASNKAYIAIYTGFYLLVSAIVFAVPQYIDSAESVTKITYIAIFQIATLNIVLRAIPMLSRANQALAELEQVKTQLLDARESGSTILPFKTSFSSISLQDCGTSIENIDSADPCGPFTMTIEAGQIIAIKGPNGSGKTTLLRLLCGLIHPDTGHILLDQEMVNGNLTAATYRELFTCVFHDSHLFDRFYGVSEVEQETFRATAIDLGIPSALISQSRDLRRHFSPAQKRRLMLALAIAQKKPILVLDDIEAGQDDWFIDKLRQDILPQLKRNGTTIVLALYRDGALTELADKVVTLPPRSAELQPTESNR